MYILKSITIKSIKIRLKYCKITDRNTGMQNVLNCQITSIKKISNIFQNFCKIQKKKKKKMMLI